MKRQMAFVTKLKKIVCIRHWEFKVGIQFNVSANNYIDEKLDRSLLCTFTFQ